MGEQTINGVDHGLGEDDPAPEVTADPPAQVEGLGADEGRDPAVQSADAVAGPDATPRDRVLPGDLTVEDPDVDRAAAAAGDDASERGTSAADAGGPSGEPVD